MKLDEIKKKAGVVLDKAIKDINAQFRKNGGFLGLKDAMLTVVEHVEDHGAELTGPEKKALAVEVGLALVRFVLPPTWTKLIPDWALRIALGYIVDKVVAVKNQVWKKKA